MKLKKLLALVLCIVAVACISVTATVAYLTDSEGVVNTFTVGDVDISLDEANVDNDVEPETSAVPARDQQNDYHLIPAKEYDKDPTVHVTADSEDCYVFVKVKNGISAIESDATGYTNIEAQIKANGWKALADVENVYWQKHTKVAGATTDTDYVVFTNFTIDADVDNTTLATYVGDLVEVTAYAIQADTFDDEIEAWNASGFAAQ